MRAVSESVRADCDTMNRASRTARRATRERENNQSGPRVKFLQYLSPKNSILMGTCFSSSGRKQALTSSSRIARKPSGNPSEQSRSAVPRDQNQSGHQYATAISIGEADAFNNHVDLKTPQENCTDPHRLCPPPKSVRNAPRLTPVRSNFAPMSPHIKHDAVAATPL